MLPVLGLAIAYLAGSIPFAYLAGRLLKGIDLRTVGSGNLGATNVLRTLGKGPAIVVLLLDAAKGALPVAFLPGVLAPEASGDARQWWALAYGMAAIAGHAKPIFLLWKGGGKGVATASGVFAAVTPFPLAVATSVFVVVTVSSGYVSLGSIVSALVLPVAVFVWNGVSPMFAVSLAIAGFIVWSHRANIARLRAGTESKVLRRGPERGA
jgi:glycerol-3-phosphate acyltransferase PlsY